MDDANDFYWQAITDEDRGYLLEPRDWPGPCPWCGGRLNHSEPCQRLQQDWMLATEMPFGRHKGKAVRDVPESYLRWWRRHIESASDLKAAIVLRLSLPKTEESPNDQ